MARRSTTAAVAGTLAAVAATTAVAAAVGGGAPTATLRGAAAREAAAVAETVRQSTVIVLADTCGAACMEGVRARLAPRCTAVTVLPHIHMVTARCGGGAAVTAAAGEGASAAATVQDLLAGLPEVEAAVPDSVVRAAAPASGGAPDRGTLRAAGHATARGLWGLDRVNQYSLPLDGDSSTTGCYPRQGAGVTVWVVDTGCTTRHPQFQGRAATQAGPGTPFRSGADGTGHGSHVAGTVGGRDTGVAQRATLQCVKVLGADGSGATSDVIATFNAIARAKARYPQVPMVLVASLGGKARLGAWAPSSIAASRASAAGVVVVVAAGNDGGDACGYAPAAATGAIAVANAGRGDTLSRTSNRGQCVDIIAPGEGILSVDGRAPWGGLTLMSGTSMAAPHVAGAAALVLGEAGAEAGRLTTADVWRRLTARALRVGGYPLAYVGGRCGRAA